ncbi:MAG: leucyl/phenylalanyl-tRNA--protein transferase, partial [Acidobacteriota bacterium]
IDWLTKMEFIDGIAIIDEYDDFPDPRYALPDCPVAVGQVLTATLMLKAYQKGIFAWSAEPVTWWSPDPRAIIELDELYVSKRLARKIRQAPFRITVDQDFPGVLQGCAAPREEGEESWITEEFFYCFNELFQAGYAHSIECWKDNLLVGGVFGVAIGGFFSAESMFHKATDASKIALFYLVELLKQVGFALLDIQILTSHTQSLGGILISRNYYLRRLKQALKLKPFPLHKTTITK